MTSTRRAPWPAPAGLRHGNRSRRALDVRPRADGRKSLAGSGAADGVPERGAAAAPHRRHHGANDMDPQTIEKAIKRCIDISTRLGALEDELPPAPRRVIVQWVDDINGLQRWLEGRE